MTNRILRAIHNNIVKLVVGLLAVGSMYLGGAALLASTIAAHMVVGPLVGAYVPEPTDIRLFVLMWFVFAAGALWVIGYVLAHPMAWVLDKLDTVQNRLSFS